MLQKWKLPFTVCLAGHCDCSVTTNLMQTTKQKSGWCLKRLAFFTVLYCHNTDSGSRKDKAWSVREFTHPFICISSPWTCSSACQSKGKINSLPHSVFRNWTSNCDSVLQTDVKTQNVMIVKVAVAVCPPTCWKSMTLWFIQELRWTSPAPKVHIKREYFPFLILAQSSASTLNINPVTVLTKDPYPNL